MAQNEGITEFNIAERVTFSFYGRERDGSVMADPASRTITLTIYDSAGSSVVSFSSAGAQITLVDATTAEFLISLSPSDLSAIVAETDYSYQIISDGATTEPALQNYGRWRQSAKTV